MNIYQNNLPSHTNTSFVDPPKEENVYEDVIRTRRLPDHRNHQERNVKSNKNDFSNCNRWMIISGISLVIGVAALAVAIGLFVSVSNQVNQLQSSTTLDIAQLSEDLLRQQQQFDELKNDTEDVNQDLLNLKTNFSQQQSDYEQLKMENDAQGDEIQMLESDVSDHQNEITHLQSQTALLDQRLDATSNITDQELVEGFKVLDDGWVTPFNGYKYFVIKDSYDWSTSITQCDNLGATLAFRGIRDLQTRRILSTAFSFSYVWIGMNKYGSIWYWIYSSAGITGDVATEESALWYYSEPDSGTCAMIYSNGHSYDYTCTSTRYPLCEKPV